MSANLLIPFGISYATAEIIEPEDAPRGRACNCYCPGCEMPLLARHPSEREDKKVEVRHYFAHDSRHPKAKKSVIKECPFNGELAIALMARNLAERFIGQKIRFPEFSFWELGEDGRVTDEKWLTIDTIETEVMALGHRFDFKLGFGLHHVLVWLSYGSGRSMPDIENEVRAEMKGAGVLEIVVSRQTLSLFSECRGRFSDFVCSFFLSEGYRKWVYHPKQDAVERRRKEIAEELFLKNTFKRENYLHKQRERYELSTTLENQPGFVPYRAKCRLCNEEWEHKEQGPLQCPNGHGHLFCVRIMNAEPS